MAQGPIKSSMSGGKVEPKSHAVSVSKVSEIGLQVIRTQPAPGAGRGFEAPKPVACVAHPSGSQGKHK